MRLEPPELPPLELPDEDPKACCARLYESDAARWLLGDELHPGGEQTTLHLAALAGWTRGDTVVDVACGAGASARLLAAERGLRVVGVDLAAALVEQAAAAATAGGLADRVRFVRGDAERLPLAAGEADGALSECALCTFPDGERAVAEMARVVRPGGVVAIADVVVDGHALPEALRTAVARIACVAGARTEPDLLELVRGAGFEVIASERRDGDLLAMIDRVHARLRVARMLVPAGEQHERAREAIALAALARDEARRGTLGYVLFAARRADDARRSASTRMPSIASATTRSH